MTRDEMITQAERHVRLGESHIFQQHQVVLNLVSSGASTDLALELLDLFQTLQSPQIEHLEALRNARR